jgi:hypothetical protein
MIAEGEERETPLPADVRSPSNLHWFEVSLGKQEHLKCAALIECMETSLFLNAALF